MGREEGRGRRDVNIQYVLVESDLSMTENIRNVKSTGAMRNPVWHCSRQQTHLTMFPVLAHRPQCHRRRSFNTALEDEEDMTQLV